MNWIADFLRLGSMNNIDVDESDRIAVHAEILSKKPLLQGVFREFHEIFDGIDRRFFVPDGSRIEIGAGVSPMRDTYSDVLATDIVSSPGLDCVLDAENMQLDDDSVRVIFAQNCFHHLPHPQRFFEEVQRVVRVGGGVILLEPYYGPVASMLFKRLFSTEGFDKEYPSWNTPAAGPMNGANQALSYIVFDRDRDAFEKRFPRLRIVHKEICNNYLSYLASGGLNFRQLCPNWAAPLVRLTEKTLRPFNRWLGLHHIVVLRKEY